MDESTVEYVFQYGSNMSSKRLCDGSRIPEAKPIEAAWTEQLFEFTFPVWSQKHHRAASGIVPATDGRRIFGAIFAIPSDLIYRRSRRYGRRTLDEIEGEGVNYRRAKIQVLGVTSNELRESITYLPINTKWIGPSDAEYVGHILAGLKEWNAPASYVKYVESVTKRALQPGVDWVQR